MVIARESGIWMDHGNPPRLMIGLLAATERDYVSCLVVAEPKVLSSLGVML